MGGKIRVLTRATSYVEQKCLYTVKVKVGVVGPDSRGTSRPEDALPAGQDVGSNRCLPLCVCVCRAERLSR
jgi:hypothetical protein